MQKQLVEAQLQAELNSKKQQVETDELKREIEQEKNKVLVLQEQVRQLEEAKLSYTVETNDKDTISVKAIDDNAKIAK